MAKFLYYMTTNGYLAYIMRDTDFYHWTLGGKASYLDLFSDFPCLKIPDYLPEFYVIKLSYYSHEMLYVLTYYRNKPDFSELVLHHFVTIILVFFSYSTNCLRIGAVVLILHGISDVWVANLKVMIEISPRKYLIVAYFIMLSSFVYTRVIVFPFIVIR